MAHLLVRHTVANFAQWKPVYDAHLQPVRKRAFERKIFCAVSTIQTK